MLPRPPEPNFLHKDPAHSMDMPIFVLGTFHSATTILYRMLAMHPDTTWFSQFSLRDGSIPGRRRLPFYAQIDRISRRMFEHDWKKRPESRKDLFMARPTEGQLIWKYVIPRSGSIEPTTSVKRLRHILETESRRWRNRYFLAKYPYTSRHIPVLRAAYPRAKFVHIVRDGRAVALSLKAHLLAAETRDYVVRDGRAVALSPKSNLLTAETRDRAPVRSEQEAFTRAAQYWLQCIRMIQAEKDRIDLTEIRYEDFCEDVHGHLAKLLRTIGLDVGKFPFHRCPATLTSTNETRMQAASPPELEALEILLGDALRLYSYV